MFCTNVFTISEVWFASFLKLTLVSFIYAVFIGFLAASSCFCFSCSSFCLSISFCVVNLSFLIQPLVVLVWTQTQSLITSTTFTFSSFFTSTMSVAFITGTIFNFVFSFTICSFVISVVCSSCSVDVFWVVVSEFELVFSSVLVVLISFLSSVLFSNVI